VNELSLSGLPVHGPIPFLKKAILHPLSPRYIILSIRVYQSSLAMSLSLEPVAVIEGTVEEVLSTSTGTFPCDPASHVNVVVLESL
jgi:hypothetical protein